MFCCLLSIHHTCAQLGKSELAVSSVEWSAAMALATEIDASLRDHAQGHIKHVVKVLWEHAAKKHEDVIDVVTKELEAIQRLDNKLKVRVSRMVA